MTFNTETTTSFKMDLTEDSPDVCKVGALRLLNKPEQVPPPSRQGLVKKSLEERMCRELPSPSSAM